MQLIPVISGTHAIDFGIILSKDCIFLDALQICKQVPRVIALTFGGWIRIL
jgi:hypothetical protein